MKNKELILVVGNIASGKTLLCREYQKRGYIVISKDSLRYAIGLGEYVFNRKYEPIIFYTEHCMLEEFMQLGVPIILDGMVMSRSLRMRYISLAKENGYKVICMLLPQLSMKESVDRRMKDKHGNFRRKTWNKVWERFNKIYEKPSLKEGIDKIIKEK